MKILFLAGDTFRAKAYMQYLSAHNNDNITVSGLLYGFSNDVKDEININIESKKFFDSQNQLIPDFNKNIYDIFIENGWSFYSIESKDVNCNDIIQKVRSEDADLVVFAGYGGQILSKEHFELGANYLHMHPGKIPLERGSTTLYYSILNRKICSVTAFLMSDLIDKGINLNIEDYQIPSKNVDVDLWYDNIVRADCFVKTIDMIINKKVEEKVVKGNGEEFFVIHPVLKHISLLSLT